MASLTDLPDGTSWRVSADGEARQYKTKAGAEKRFRELRALGKTPVISEYCRETITSTIKEIIT